MTGGFDISQSTKTILVVEDIDLIRELIVTILQSPDFTVLQSANGYDALRIAADDTQKIDLLLTDISLPGMSGVQLAQAIKELRPRTQVMLMSAFTAGTLGDDSKWLFIQKPFTARQLLDEIRAALHPVNPTSHGA